MGSRKVHEAWARRHLNPSGSRRQSRKRAIISANGIRRRPRLMPQAEEKIGKRRKFDKESYHDRLHRGLGAYAVRQAGRRDASKA